VIHGFPYEDQDIRHMGALRKVMPITATAFIIAWLAIAGVPPFAGFWSKDEILVNAWDKSPVLWLFGELGALLTAFYMAREVYLVFYGKRRWDEARPDYSNLPPSERELVPMAAGAAVNEEVVAEGQGHPHAPHESPWTMTVPLIVLSVGAVFGGLLNLPFSGHLRFLEHWLDPVVGEFSHDLSLSGAQQWVFAIVSAAVAVAGIVVAYLIYDRRRIKAVEPAVLEHAWYYDEAVSAFMGGPGYESFEDVAWFDANVVDGGVNGIGKLARLTGRGLRHLQSGYVRNYALGISIGAVALIAWLVSRGAL
jgi:NADH-quinone oxidoreductase subunit L